MRHTPDWVWITACAAFALCALAFLALDPNPNLLLAASAGLNAGILVWSGYRCYRLRILLSPVGQILIGPGLILYYSIGNLGARMEGDFRFAANPGSLDYYPVASALCTLGILIFCLVVFLVLPRQLETPRLAYEQLEWTWSQGLASALLASAVLVYLSTSHPFVNGYFRGVDSQIDIWLSASIYYFSLLAVIVNTSVFARPAAPPRRFVAAACLCLMIGQSVLLRSRTFMAVMILTSLFAYLTIRPRTPGRSSAFALCALAIVFMLGTAVKSSGGPGTSILDNATALQNANLSVTGALSVDRQYRLAGLELPAALLACFDRGAEPMRGEAMLQGLLQGLPNFLRPGGDYSERIAITGHFGAAGLLYGDSIGVPLSSGLADWGPAGVLIYAVMAIYPVAVWRLCQRSPRLLTALLMTGNGMYFFDLFWENNVIFALRTIGFSWLVLLVLSPLLSPRVAEQPEAD
jgi:hypothetical protein